MSNDKVREAFEAHWYDFYHAGSITARSDGRYFNATVNAAWDAWQIAFQAGRESAIREAIAAPGVATDEKTIALAMLAVDDPLAWGKLGAEGGKAMIKQFVSALFAQVEPAGGDKENADWPITWEVSWGELDEDDECSPCGWRVHDRRGSRNDREWELIATGNTPAEAIRAARAAQQATGERK